MGNKEFVPKCTCGKQVSGICNGHGDCKVVIWGDFVKKYGITPEEQIELHRYLKAYRLMPYTDRLRAIQLELKNIFKAIDNG